MEYRLPIDTTRRFKALGLDIACASPGNLRSSLTCACASAFHRPPSNDRHSAPACARLPPAGCMPARLPTHRPIAPLAHQRGRLRAPSPQNPRRRDRRLRLRPVSVRSRVLHWRWRVCWELHWGSAGCCTEGRAHVPPACCESSPPAIQSDGSTARPSSRGARGPSFNPAWPAATPSSSRPCGLAGGWPS